LQPGNKGEASRLDSVIKGVYVDLKGWLKSFDAVQELRYLWDVKDRLIEELEYHWVEHANYCRRMSTKADYPEIKVQMNPARCCGHCCPTLWLLANRLRQLSTSFLAISISNRRQCE